MSLIKYHKDLIVYQKAFDSAMQIYSLSKSFPVEEKYSLTETIERIPLLRAANRVGK